MSRKIRKCTSKEEALKEVVEALNVAMVNPGRATAALADCVHALRGIALNRSLSFPWKFVEFVPAKGPIVTTVARLLSQEHFSTSKFQALDITMEIWETRGGALIAISCAKQRQDGGGQDRRVTVVEPQDDIQAMHFAVLDALKWHNTARAMAESLGWNLRLDVE